MVAICTLQLTARYYTCQLFARERVCCKVASLHDRVGEEVDPDPVPPDTVFLDDLVLVGDPVEVPSVDSGRVVDTEDVDGLDLKVCRFELHRSGTTLGDKDKYVEGGVSTLLMTHPRGREASAPGKTYLFILSIQLISTRANVRKRLAYKRPQTRSSYCQQVLIPATWKTMTPSSARRL